MLNKIFLLMTLLIVASTSAAVAQNAVYEVDPHSSNSKVTFTSGTVFYDVVGAFKDFSGEIDLDPANVGQARVSMIVNIASLDTGNSDRDKHLKSVDFFDLQNFPQAKFQNVHVEQTGDHTLTMQGRLELKGMRRMTQWNVTSIKSYVDGQGKARVVFSAQTSVDRKDFGIFWNADPNTYNPLNEKKKDGFWSQLKDSALKTVGNQFISTDEVKIDAQLEAVKK